MDPTKRIPHGIRENRASSAGTEALHSPILKACVPRMNEVSLRNEIVSFTLRFGSAPLNP